MHARKLLHSYRQAVKILQILHYGLADHFGPAALVCRSRYIQGCNMFVRQTGSDLG